MKRIENWGLVALEHDPYTPPELQVKGLHGRVFGHPDFAEGTSVTTSSIIGVRREGEKVFVSTRSGSEYELGAVSPEYEALYPNALERVAAYAQKHP